MIFSYLFVLVLVLLDQGVKYAIVTYLALGHHLDLLPGIALYHVQNNGIAFSMFASFNKWALIGLTVGVIIFVAALWWKVRHTSFFGYGGYLLVLGGAFGNLIDRWRFNAVTDYILIYYGDWSFAVFNLADSFITVGALLIILREFFGRSILR